MEDGSYSTLIYISSNSEFLWILETHTSIINVGVSSHETARFFGKLLNEIKASCSAFFNFEIIMHVILAFINDGCDSMNELRYFASSLFFGGDNYNMTSVALNICTVHGFAFLQLVHQ